MYTNETPSGYNTSPVYLRYQEAFNDVKNATKMIERRLRKIKQESDILKGVGNSLIHSYRDLSGSNLKINKYNLINPNLYSNQYIDPIYYPLEMPINGEPISLPKIELGMPLNEIKNGTGHTGHVHGLNISDALVLMRKMSNRKKSKKKR